MTYFKRILKAKLSTTKKKLNRKTLKNQNRYFFVGKTKETIVT